MQSIVIFESILIYYKCGVEIPMKQCDEIKEKIDRLNLVKHNLKNKTINNLSTNYFK